MLLISGKYKKLSELMDKKIMKLDERLYPEYISSKEFNNYCTDAFELWYPSFDALNKNLIKIKFDDDELKEAIESASMFTRRDSNPSEISFSASTEKFQFLLNKSSSLYFN